MGQTSELMDKIDGAAIKKNQLIEESFAKYAAR